MDIKIDFQYNTSLYQQIIDTIEKMIKEEKIAKGEELPSIRCLAKKLDVSVITVKRAYEVLKSKKLIYSYQAKGYYVL